MHLFGSESLAYKTTPHQHPLKKRRPRTYLCLLTLIPGPLQARRRLRDVHRPGVRRPVLPSILVLRQPFKAPIEISQPWFALATTARRRLLLSAFALVAVILLVSCIVRIVVGPCDWLAVGVLLDRVDRLEDFRPAQQTVAATLRRAVLVRGLDGVRYRSDHRHVRDVRAESRDEK